MIPKWALNKPCSGCLYSFYMSPSCNIYPSSLSASYHTGQPQIVIAPHGEMGEFTSIHNTLKCRRVFQMHCQYRTNFLLYNGHIVKMIENSVVCTQSHKTFGISNFSISKGLVQFIFLCLTLIEIFLFFILAILVLSSNL